VQTTYPQVFSKLGRPLCSATAKSSKPYHLLLYWFSNLFLLFNFEPFIQYN
jgi:hypothetical protein